MTQHQETLIEKIKKLFAMAQRQVNNDGSSNEAEAAAAMAKAQELLTKYNLDLKAVEDAKPKAEQQASMGGPRERQQVNRSAMYRWQQQFWAALAASNYCFHWITDAYAKTNRGDNRRVKRHVILGSQANVAAVLVMGDYLTETIERLLPYPNSERLSKAALSWREGCAQRLIERIQEKLERMKSEGVRDESGAVACTALAVRDLAQAEYIANYDARYGAGAYARKLRNDTDWEARRKEREAEWAAQLKAQDDAEALARQKETPAQHKRREEREARQEERENRRYWRQHYQEQSRLDRTAYNAGRTKAEDINLDDQLKGGAK